VAEYLRKVRRQATALVVREIMPEFPLPLGVWFVRENIRSMLKGTPKEFDDLKSCLTYLKTFLTVPIPKWLEESAILRDTILQRRMDDYFHCSEFKQLG